MKYLSVLRLIIIIVFTLCDCICMDQLYKFINVFNCLCINYHLHVFSVYDLRPNNQCRRRLRVHTSFIHIVCNGLKFRFLIRQTDGIICKV